MNGLVESSKLPDYVTAIDRVEESFSRCWDDLVLLKCLQLPRSTPDFFTDFQVRLAEALFALEDTYRDVSAFTIKLIARKRGHTKVAFESEIRAAARAKEVLVAAMKVGRSLGDAFAWFLYSRSQPSLPKHFAHQRIDHMPPGLGGQGELAVLRSIRSPRHILLYHGITTFLRVGDFSLISIEDLEAKSLLEVKTRMSSPNTASVEITLLSASSEPPPSFFRHLASKTTLLASKSPGENHYSAVKEKARLQRQLKSMTSVVNVDQPNAKRDVYEAYHSKALNNCSFSSEVSTAFFQLVDQFLLTCCMRLGHEKTLASRLLAQLDSMALPSAEELSRAVLAILDPEKEGNSLLVSGMQMTTRLCFVPPFWIPNGASLALLRMFYFHEAHLINFFNPRGFFDKLRGQGLKVHETRVNDQPNYVVERECTNGHVERIEGVEHSIHQITYNYQREDVVIESFLNGADFAKANGRRVKVEYHFVHHLVFDAPSLE